MTDRVLWSALIALAAFVGVVALALAKHAGPILVVAALFVLMLLTG